MSASSSKPEFVIAIPIYDGVDLMDMAAPTELFFTMNSYWADKQAVIYHVAEKNDKVTTRDGTVLFPHKTFAELQTADLLWTPGGDPAALQRLMYTAAGEPYLRYLKQVSKKATWVTSVCEGALLLAQAGLLKGYKATTHWAFMECLRNPRYGITVMEEGHPRYVVDRNRVTGAGISAGMDEALAIIEILAGTDVAMSVQRLTQYYPQPPVTGSIPKVPGACPVKAPS